MILEEAIVAHLRANSGVSSLVPAASRITFDVLEQGTAYPAIAMTIVSKDQNHAQGMSSGTASTRVQIDCLSTSLLQARAVRDAVALALDGFAGSMGGSGGVQVDGAWIDDGRVGYDDDLRVHVVSDDFLIMHHGAAP